MSRDGTMDDESETQTDQVTDESGLPGYVTNNSIPRGSELPVPVREAADPWATTWDFDTDFGSAVDTDDTISPYAAELTPAATDRSQPGESEQSESGQSESEPSGWVPQGRAVADPAPPEGEVAAEAGSAAFRNGLASSSQAPFEATPPAPSIASTPAQTGVGRPSAEDLMSARSKGQRQRMKASSGLRKAFGLGPGRAELLERDRIDRIARPMNGRKTIMVINTKGGGGKTLVTLMLANYLGRYRSGSVLAWDNNETEGTLGMRAPSQPHHRTVVDLLGALPQIETDATAGPSELEHWVREQRGLGFDVLASADDDEAMRIIGEDEFNALHAQLSRFYRMVVVDTGNNRLSPNWLSAAAQADLLVFATSLKDDTSVVAAKNLDALVAMGRQDLVRNAVCVISHTSAHGDIGAGVHTREHFEQWVRAVVDIPYDPMLAPGLRLDPTKVAKRTHAACMELTAAVVDGL